MNKNILICLEQIGIGGVETAVITQAIALKKKGYNITILAKSGIYLEKIKENNIEYIEFDFNLANYIDINKIMEIVKIIKEKDIGQVHIHQFPCILSVYFACVITNKPYVAFLHTVPKEDYAWYENTFEIYKYLWNMYFENAEKIVVVTQRGLQIHQELFPNLSGEKYVILPNCIDFDEYKEEKKVTEVKKFALISRFSNEKMKSILNGIELFIDYAEKYDRESSLDIIGDGITKKQVEEYIESKNNSNLNINMIGQSSTISKDINNYDVIIGIGRCILEAIAMKRIAILSGIEELKVIVTPENIEQAYLGNFAGRIFENVTSEQMAYEINNLKNQNLEEMLNKNYNVLKQNLDINNRVFCLSENNMVQKDYIGIWKYIIETYNNYAVIKKEYENLKVQNQKEIVEKENMIKEQEKIIREQENLIAKEKEEKKQKIIEIEKVYNSKRWRCANKIMNTINKIRGKKG